MPIRFKPLWLITIFVSYLTIWTIDAYPRLQVSSNTAQAVPGVSFKRRLEEHRSLIEERLKAMNSRYAYGPAKLTLDRVFKESNVISSLGYTESWGNNGLWLTWEQALGFYRYHSTALQESLNTVPARGTISGADLDYFEQGMAGWKAHEQQLDKYMQDMVGIYLKEARNLDQQYALQEKYSQLRATAQRQQNSSLVDSLRKQEADELKPLKQEAQQLYDTRTALRTTIEEHAKKRFFEARKFSGSSQTTSRTTGRTPAEERRTREPLVLTGRAPGAAEKAKP